MYNHFFMRRRTLAAIIIVAIAAHAGNAKRVEPKPRASLRFSCFKKPFLSVSLHTPKRDRFPEVELRLTDPRGRSGDGAGAKRIPKSQSGRVNDVPGHPTLTKAVAVEVCDAIQGDYSVIVSGHEDQRYLMTISADDGRLGNEAMSSDLNIHRDRTCRYWFRFSMGSGHATVHWLEGTNHMQAGEPLCEPVPR